MRKLVALFCLLAVPAYSQCTPPAQQDVEIVLPGKAPMPSGSQLRMKIPVTVVQGDCPAPVATPVDPLHGAPPPRRGLLQGDGDGNLLNRPPPLHRGTNDP